MFAKLLAVMILLSGIASAQPAIIQSVENRYVLQEGGSYLANVTVRNYEASAQFNISFLIDGVINSSVLVMINTNHTEPFMFSSSGDQGKCYNLTFLLLDSLGVTLYDMEETETCIIGDIPRKPERFIVPEYPLPFLFLLLLSLFLFLHRSE